MSEKLWNRAVTIEIDDKTVFSIRTTREAAWCLLDDWNAVKGVAYRNAVTACSNALAEKSPDPVARFLFVTAARDAGFKVKISGDILEPDQLLSDLTELAFQDLFSMRSLIINEGERSPLCDGSE